MTRWRLPFVLLVALGILALAASSAQGFRRPTPSERSGVLRAFDKHHGSKARRLYVEEIRVSTRDRRYAALLYDTKGIGFNGKPTGLGPTRLDYFKRTGAGRRAARAAGGTTIISDFESLGQDVPASERDENDPLYRVTYATTADEHITRKTTWSCSDGSTPTTTSTGDYHWSETWVNVPLSRPNFSVTNRMGSFTGTSNWTDPCPRTSVGACPSSLSIKYRSSGSPAARRITGTGISSFFANGYLVVDAPNVGDTHGCVLLEKDAFPISAAELRLPFDWFGGPFEEKRWDVGHSDFPDFLTKGRFGDCEPLETKNSCSETLDGFAAAVVAKRTRRGR